MCLGEGGARGDEQIQHLQWGGGSSILDEIREGEGGSKKPYFQREV